MRRFALSAAALVVLAGCGAADSLLDDSVFSLEVGTCFDDGDLTETEVSSVDDLSCDEPHDNEVYALFDITEPDFSDERISMIAAQGCLERFDAYVGARYLDSALEFFPITPTESSWDGGDREVICALYALDFSKLTGSMRNSGR